MPAAEVPEGGDGRSLESMQRESWDRLERGRGKLKVARVDEEMERWIREGTVEEHLAPVRRKIHLVGR